MVNHCYHYHVHSEQRYFLGQARELFNLVALNGNIVSHTPSGVAAFIATTNKPFYIDPQTHAFQHDTDLLKRDVSNSEGSEEPQLEFKPSVSNLAHKHLGGPFARVIDENQPIHPLVFTNERGEVDPTSIVPVAESCVEFQLRVLENSLKAEDKEFISAEQFKPAFVLAPYFYLGEREFTRWLRLNRAFYVKTKELCRDLPVYYSLVISKKVLDLAQDDLISEAAAIRPDGILLWIDEHTEEDLSKNDIRRYIALLRGLRSHTETIINTHGGYLSILLCHNQTGPLLNGVGHSINYGESRAVIPVGGGLPMARFYFRPLHTRLRPADALDIAMTMDWFQSVEVYRGNVCKCQQCTELLSSTDSPSKTFELYSATTVKRFRRRDGTWVSREYPTADARRYASRHYLFNKAQEFSDVESESLLELLARLKSSYNTITQQTGGFENTSHLTMWHDALSELELGS